MILSGIETFAQVAVERIINSLPEGILIALGASLLLGLMRRQNAGTRFAVWLLALVGVVALPFFGIPGLEQHLAHFQPRSAFVVPSFWALASLIVWVLLASAALARVVVGLWLIRQFRKSCVEICTADLDPALRSILEQRNQPVRLLVSEKARVPAALGFIKPAVVLPAWILRDFSPEELRPILIHELAHLRRYDSWTNLFQKTACALFFFHPAVWWIDGRLSLEREMACDDAVLTATGGPHAYAASLISLLEKSCRRRGWTMAQAAVTRAREASLRISRILNTGASASTRIALPTLGLAAALFVACGGVALRVPRLLTFSPTASAVASSVQSQWHGMRQIGPRTNDVVPAAFHPMSKTGLVRNAGIRQATSPPHCALRPVALRKLHSAETPHVMTSFISSANAGSSVTRTVMVIEASVGLGLPSPSMERKTIDVQKVEFIEQAGAGFFVRIWITLPATEPAQHGSISRVI